MPKAKKIFLLNERRETWRIKLERSQKGFCERCGDEVVWLTARGSMQILKLSEREVVRLAEQHVVHSLEDEAGFLLICRRSLQGFGKEMES